MGKQVVVRFMRNEIEAQREVCTRALHTIADAIRVTEIDQTMARLERTFVVIHEATWAQPVEARRQIEPPRRTARGSGPIRTWLRANGLK